MLPWLYIGVDLLVDLEAYMQGFAYLPFFALLFLKETALKTRKERSRLFSRNIGYQEGALMVVAAVLLTVAFVTASSRMIEVTSAHREWAWTLFALFVLGSIAWDIRRAYRMCQAAD